METGTTQTHKDTEGNQGKRKQERNKEELKLIKPSDSKEVKLNTNHRQLHWELQNKIGK